MTPIPARRGHQRPTAAREDELGNTMMPSLSAWLRRVRQERGLTRRQVEERTHISVDYINKIEAGFVPSREIIERLTAGYSLNPMQVRHTRELWEPPIALPSVDELRERVNTPTRLEDLARLDDAGIICVYTDPLWNILSANASFHHALPGMNEARSNVACWFFRARHFREPSADVTLQWENEVHFHVAMLRGAFGLYRESPRARDLFDRLKHDPIFSREWRGSISVAYARRPGDLAHLRDPSTGDPYSLSIDIAEVADTRDIRVCYAFKRPYAGNRRT